MQAGQLLEQGRVKAAAAVAAAAVVVMAAAVAAAVASGTVVWRRSPYVCACWRVHFGVSHGWCRWMLLWTPMYPSSRSRLYISPSQARLLVIAVLVIAVVVLAVVMVGVVIAVVVVVVVVVGVVVG